jgi:hypothetical protein
MSEEDAGEEEREPSERPAPRGNKAAALVVACGVTAVTAGAMSFAFRPDQQKSPLVLVVMALTYGLLLVGCVAWLRRRGELRSASPRKGAM